MLSGTARCTGFQEARPQEEQDKALEDEAVRRKEPVGRGMGERNSCRGREQKLTLLSSPAPCHSPTPATTAAASAAVQAQHPSCSPQASCAARTQPGWRGDVSHS